MLSWDRAGWKCPGVQTSAEGITNPTGKGKLNCNDMPLCTRVASIKRLTTLSADKYVEQLELSDLWGKCRCVFVYCQQSINFLL